MVGVNDAETSRIHAWLISRNNGIDKRVSAVILGLYGIMSVARGSYLKNHGGQQELEHGRIAT